MFVSVSWKGGGVLTYDNQMLTLDRYGPNEQESAVLL